MNFNITFFHLSWAVCWYALLIKHNIVCVDDATFSGIESPASALSRIAIRDHCIQPELLEV